MTKTKKSKGLLPNIEFLIIAVFFISFIIIMIPKCESTQQAYEAETAIENVDSVETENFAIPPPKVVTAPIADNSTNAIGIEKTRLYVTVEDLKLRQAPNVVGEIITKLSLFQEVFYENETTTKKKKIDWGDGLITNEPWVKISTKDGRIGWVYGAGVHFYKRPLQQITTDTTLNIQ